MNKASRKASFVHYICNSKNTFMKRIRIGNYNPMWLVFRTLDNNIVYKNHLGNDDCLSEISSQCPLIIQVLSDKRYAKYMNFDKLLFVENQGSNSPFYLLQGKPLYYPLNYSTSFKTKDLSCLKKALLAKVKEYVKSDNKDYLSIQLGSSSGSYECGIKSNYTKHYHEYSFSLTTLEESKIPIESLRKLYIDNALKDL